jgi:hypothetical protein
MVDVVVHAGVFAVYVAVSRGGHAGVIQRSRKDATLLGSPAFDFDLAELLVPCSACAGGYFFVRDCRR